MGMSSDEKHFQELCFKAQSLIENIEKAIHDLDEDKKEREEAANQAADDYVEDLTDLLMSEDKYSERSQHVLNEIRYIYFLNELLKADIKKRGAVELFIQGSQTLWRDNKSVDKIVKNSGEIIKLLEKLGLTPPQIEANKPKPDESDDFDDF